MGPAAPELRSSGLSSSSSDSLKKFGGTSACRTHVHTNTTVGGIERSTAGQRDATRMRTLDAHARRMLQRAQVIDDLGTAASKKSAVTRRGHGGSSGRKVRHASPSGTRGTRAAARVLGGALPMRPRPPPLGSPSPSRIHVRGLFQILARVHVLHVGRREVQTKVGRVVLKVVIVRQLCARRTPACLATAKQRRWCWNQGGNRQVPHARTIRERGVERDRRLVRPAARHVTDGVPTAAEQQQRHVERLYKLHTVRMA